MAAVNKTLHVPGRVLSVLLETSGEEGGAEVEQVIAAAVRAFSTQDEGFRHWFVRDFVIEGRGNLRSDSRNQNRGGRTHGLARRLVAALGRYLGRPRRR